MVINCTEKYSSGAGLADVGGNVLHPSSGEEQGLSLCGLEKAEHITHIFGHHQQERPRASLTLWRELNRFQLRGMLLGCSERGEKNM